MKSIKKLLAALLSLAIIFCSVPIIASADNTACFTDATLNSRPDFLWGAVMHTPYWSYVYPTLKIEEQLSFAHSMGAKFIRIDSSAPEGHIDKVVRLCNAYGIKVMLIGYGNVSPQSPCSDTASLTAHFKSMAERYNGLNGHGRVDYIQVFNEIDCLMLDYQYHGVGTPNGASVSHYNTTYMNNIITYFRAALDGIKQVNNAPQSVINISYYHYGMLTAFENAGLDWDIIGHDWYSDMYVPSNNDYYNSIGRALTDNFDKPILICEANIRVSEADAASADTDPTASNWDGLIECAKQAYSFKEVIGMAFYELMDEPERLAENGNVFTSEAYFGLMKMENGVITPKPIYYRLKNLIRGSGNATDIPVFGTQYSVIDAEAGEVISTTVKAGANMYPDYRMAKSFSHSMDATSADYLEFDIYADTATENQIWIWMSDNQDSTFFRGAWLLPVLCDGWNHIVIDITSCSRYLTSYDKSKFSNFNSIFFEGSPSSKNDVYLKVANIAVTSSAGTAPEVNTEYFYLDGIDNMLNTVTVPAGENMYINYKMGTYFSKVLNPVKADYLEFDIYSSVDNTSQVGVWLSDGVDISLNRAVFSVPSLKMGWNHIVIDLDSPVRCEREYSRSSFNNFNSLFFEGIISPEKNITLSIANVSLTADLNPTAVPEAEYKYNVCKAISSVDLHGYKTNTSDNRYFLSEQYNKQGSIDTVFDITGGAQYAEFDYFSTIADTLTLSLGSEDTYGFYNLYSEKAAVKVEKGWNHIVLPLSEFLSLSSDTSSAGKYDPAAVSGIVLFDLNSDYVRLTNFAFTTAMPSAEFNYSVIDYVDGFVASKHWNKNVTDIYNNVENRLFISLPKVMDISNAEYIEFDIYADAQMNDISIWICNNLDGEGRIRKFVEFSKLVIPGSWNHIVLDISSFLYMHGNMDKTRWTSVFFEGDPNPDGVPLNIKIANLGASQSVPYMNNIYETVSTAVNGIADSNTPTTVPKGENLYSEYQMWNAFESIDVSDANCIEIDIYASAPTENNIYIWSGLDVTGKRGMWKIPLLNQGWNHIVINLIDDFVGGNDGFTLNDFNSWSGYFFDGVPSTSRDITFMIANIALTKDSSVKNPIKYKGGLISVYNAYSEMPIPANTEVSKSVPEISLPIALNTDDIDYIEFNIYVTSECNLTLNLNSSKSAMFPSTNAKIELPKLNKGWNRVSVSIDDIVNIGTGFKKAAVRNIYFSGIISDTEDSVISVEDFAFTSAALTYKINKGDYNSDNSIDIRDLIFVRKSIISGSNTVWFANVSELDGAADGLMNSLDLTALRKYLFQYF